MQEVAQCFNQTPPVFDPSRSSTYSTVPWDAPTCYQAGGYACHIDEEDCCYRISYGSGSTSTEGTISIDAFAFEDNRQNMVDVCHLVFGCSDYTTGTFKGYEVGIVGLNQDSLSLVS